MENYHNKLNQTNIKLKIKNISYLKSQNINLKVFPILNIYSNLNGKIYINTNIKKKFFFK